MNQTGKGILIWLALAVFLVAIFNFFQGDSAMRVANSNVIAFSDFINEVSQGQVNEVTIKGQTIAINTNDGRRMVTYAPFDPQLTTRLLEKGVKINAAPIDDSPTFLHILLSWIPVLLLIGMWVFSLRQMQSSGNRAMSFGKSKARMNAFNNKVTFEDVAGIEEAKSELMEIVDFLKDPKKYQKLGAKIPKGVLLVGSPGTGKTLLARAIAGEASVPFFSISGSDFVEMFVGVGASRVRDMFQQGKENAPCIIFIDEIDAVGRHRGIGLGGGNDEREQTLNQLLVEMDGFEANSGVIIVAATNRADVLDPALLRPGRFDRHITVSNPDLAGREKILRVHTRKVPLANDVDLQVVARATPGFSGADLANLVNEAALLAASLNKRVVSMTHFEQAKDKILMGSARRSLVMSDEEKKLTAYHEGGHALVAYHMPASDPIHKATILPRGRALGMVMRLPEKDKFSMPRSELEADLAVAVAGRLAEEIIFGPEKVTTGAESDIAQATRIAKKMVTQWGMSDTLGTIDYAKNGDYYGDKSITSEHSSKLIDQEVRKIIEKANDTATKILKKNIKQLHKLAEALLKYETLSGDEISKLLKGEELEIIRESNDEPKPPRSSSLPKGGSSVGGEQIA